MNYYLFTFSIDGVVQSRIISGMYRLSMVELTLKMVHTEVKAVSPISMLTLDKSEFDKLKVVYNGKS